MVLYIHDNCAVLDVRNLYNELREYESVKDEVVQTSIKVARLSKAVVYSVIRKDFEAAERALREMNQTAAKLKELIAKWPMFYGSAATGLQEYVEANVLYYFMKEGKLPPREELGVDVYVYLMGVADVAGELGRSATEELLRKNIEAAKRLKEVVERLYLDLLSLEPRDFELRKKVDYVGSQANWISEKLFYATTCRREEA
ncbi:MULTISPECIES: haloacid dehalogenase [Pyrobaculum]|uniref:Translin n=2 Tax=Pyrobaculum arsenaticum TaxID=121277 RepID=A4WIL1_PYRAR|nr:haloacid dehalogenase [Pyrobaculum arsenaticum]ABP50228.1 Translin [Pyrobaculum arsenaticum DSM 13514]MCY0889877.1 haloacid dehalogenase [Pyrobaculum arsenaticum]NYR14835.1 haloacid dehalogenase [Pyrobaculum arsenaticum]